MAVSDIYLYEDVPVLKNKLEIRDEKTLDLIEAEQSRAKMRLAIVHFAYYRPTIFPNICFFPSSYRWITTMTVSPVLKSESS